MRDRRQQRREEHQERRGGPLGGGGDKTHYQMREKLVSIGDDFWIENDRAEKVFKVDGKALRVRQTLIFEDRSGKELAKLQERMLRVKDSMEHNIPHEEKKGRQGPAWRGRPCRRNFVVSTVQKAHSLRDRESAALYDILVTVRCTMTSVSERRSSMSTLIVIAYPEEHRA